MDFAQPVYNTIGKTYDRTRQADPFLVERIIHYLQPKTGQKYLDIGCGSGNYTGALSKQGLSIEGIDLSSEMLQKARTKFPSITWHEGNARSMSFSDAAYDGATCILATHHIKNIQAAFKEAYRVINQGHFVIFTATPEQCLHYWLHHYFPSMIEEGAALMSSFEELQKALLQAGFENIQSERYFVTSDLKDWFLHAGKYRPEIYLDPNVRAGISSFQLTRHHQEIEYGLKLLENDIKTREIENNIASYENKLGDYLFVVGEKRNHPC